MSLDHIDADGFRANVGIIVSNDAGQLLWAGRAGRPGWQFPQGGILKNESPLEAMYRELAEEVGLTPGHVELLGTTQNWLRYRLPRRYRRPTEPVCIGQKQRWYLLRLTGADAAVHFDSTDSPEFDRWRWVEYWRPLREVIYFKRKVYKRALEEFEPLVMVPDKTPAQNPTG